MDGRNTRKGPESRNPVSVVCASFAPQMVEKSIYLPMTGDHAGFIKWFRFIYFNPMINININLWDVFSTEFRVWISTIFLLVIVAFKDPPTGTRRNNNVIMTSERRRDVILTSYWRYFLVVCPLGKRPKSPVLISYVKFHQISLFWVRFENFWLSYSTFFDTETMKV